MAIERPIIVNTPLEQIAGLLGALGFLPQNPYEDPHGAMIHEFTRGEARVCIASQTDGVRQILVHSGGQFVSIQQGLQKAAFASGTEGR